MQPQPEGKREAHIARDSINWAALGGEAQRVWAVFMQAPVPLCIAEGPQHRVTFANSAYRALLGGRDVVGRRLIEALPGLSAQSLEELLNQVTDTGEPQVAREISVTLPPVMPERPARPERPERPERQERSEPAFFNFVYSPKRNAQGQVDGVFVCACDVTQEARSHRRAEAHCEQLRASDEHLRQVVRASGTGTWELDLMAGRVMADTRHRALLGTPQEAPLTLSSALEMIHEEDRERVASVIAAAFVPNGSGLFVVEYRSARSPGLERWVESRGQVIRNAEGRPVRIIGTTVNISQRKAADALQARHGALHAQVSLTLARSTSEHKMLEECAGAFVSQLDAALTRIWLLNPKDNVLELHASAGRYTHLGVDQDRLPIGEFRIGLLVDAAETDDSSAAEPWEGNLSWARREGILAFTGLPLLLGDMLVGVIGVYFQRVPSPETVDLIKQLTGHIALGIKRLRAENELRTRADFEKHLLGIVSHDLRNPLHAILLSATALAHWESLDALALKTVMRIQSSAERAARMIRDLLDFTQARMGGGLRITRKPVVLHEIIRSVLDEVEAAHPGREIRVRLDGDGHGEWDGDRIAQLVQNLVTNAIKYSPADTPVQIFTSAAPGRVSFSVHNHGDPIPESRLSSLFEPLMRGTAEVDRTGRSIGLGLYIVRQIAEAHGGRVEVRSTTGEGTTFTVLLPR